VRNLKLQSCIALNMACYGARMFAGDCCVCDGNTVGSAWRWWIGIVYLGFDLVLLQHWMLCARSNHCVHGRLPL